MPRFAILTHDHPEWHWDFLLEAGQECRTWRLADEPAVGATIPAEAIADHRLKYLAYEGPVSGNRGQVTQWDAGGYEWIQDDERAIIVRLMGRRLQCVCRLTRIADVSWQIELIPES